MHREKGWRHTEKDTRREADVRMHRRRRLCGWVMEPQAKESQELPADASAAGGKQGLSPEPSEGTADLGPLATKTGSR